MSKFKLYSYGFVAVVVIILGVIGWHYLVGFTPGRKQQIKHVQSDLIGLKRVIEQYDANGKVINKFEGRYRIEVEGAFISFTHEGKNVKLSGNILIREVD
jgi:hypothetical protein